MNLLGLAAIYTKTCSIETLEDKAVTFVRSPKYLAILLSNLKEENIVTLVPFSMERDVRKYKNKLKTILVKDVERVFVMYHNWVNAKRHPRLHEIDKGSCLDPTVTLSNKAMKYIYSPDMNRPVLMKHMGNIVIEKEVEVYGYTTIHRASLGSTILHKNVKVGAYCNVGHNVVINKNTILAPYVCLGGSSVIGEECFLGMGTIVRDGIFICNRVKTGMGSRVVKNITEPGVYIGSPAVRKGGWDGCWHK